jgi:hypothetical protein
MKCFTPHAIALSISEREAAVIVFQWVLDRLGYNDRTGEVHDRLHLVAVERRLHERLVVDRSLDEGRALIDRPAESGHQIVDHHHRIAGIEKREHGMAADVAGAPGHKHGRFRHGVPLGVDVDRIKSASHCGFPRLELR